MQLETADLHPGTAIWRSQRNNNIDVRLVPPSGELDETYASSLIPTYSCHYYFALGRGAKYCDQRVCLSVCPLAYLKIHTSKFHQKRSCTCYPWPWLDPL